MGDRWTYPTELADALGALGFAPRAETPPLLVRNAVDELYKYELRRLRDRQRSGAMAKSDFAEAVVALRRKYWVLTLPVGAWQEICRGEPVDRASDPPNR